MSKKLGPGDRIEARCTRCNDITGHVIVFLLNDVINKVECCACKSVHKYTAPIPPKTVRAKAQAHRVKPGEDRAAATSAALATSSEHDDTATVSTPRAAAKMSASQTRAATKAAKDAEQQAQAWQFALNANAATPKIYTMLAFWEKGSVIVHPTFGQGIVTDQVPPDKMHVLFRDGIRLLKNGINPNPPMPEPKKAAWKRNSRPATQS